MHLSTKAQYQGSTVPGVPMVRAEFLRVRLSTKGLKMGLQCLACALVPSLHVHEVM